VNEAPSLGGDFAGGCLWQRASRRGGRAFRRGHTFRRGILLRSTQVSQGSINTGRSSGMDSRGTREAPIDRMKGSGGTAPFAEAGGAIRLTANPVSKRLFDILLASIGLLVTAPLWPVVSVFIWLEDGRPLLLTQERIGRGGSPFRLFKFRTMWRDAPMVGVVEDREHDPRVTRVGRLLRATALDELPQLLNIIRGDISFVGPRALPLRIEDSEQTRYRTIEDIEGYELRSRVRPGLTGLAQVYAPKAISRRSKFRYDLFYVKRWTFWLDIRLVALSIWISLRAKWESRGKKA